MAYRPNCMVCRKCKEDPDLKRRVYHAKFQWEDGDETLADIIRDNHGKFTHVSMYNHCNKHIQKKQRSAQLLEVQTAKKVAKIKAEVNKKLEVSLDKDELTATDLFELSLDDYLGQGTAILRQGNMKITEKGFLTAIKIKADIQAKKRGQDIEIVKAMYAFSSGSKKESDEIKEKAEKAKELINGTDTNPDAGSADSGQARPDSFYRDLIGDAPS